MRHGWTRLPFQDLAAGGETRNHLLNICQAHKFTRVCNVLLHRQTVGQPQKNKCSVCSQVTHNASNCPVLASLGSIAQIRTEADMSAPGVVSVCRGLHIFCYESFP